MIAALRDFIQTCPFITEFSTNETPLDWTDPESNHGVECIGDERIGSYVGGMEKRAATYALYARNCTAADANRISNNKFSERFTRWIAQQQRARSLPLLSDGRTALTLEASNGMLLSYGDSVSTGTYKIKIRMTYTMEV